MFASAGTPYQALVVTGSHTYNSLMTEFISPNIVVLGGVTPGPSLALALNHYWQVLTEVLITLGLGFVLWRRKTQKMTTALFLLSLASFAVLLVVVGVPYHWGAR